MTIEIRKQVFSASVISQFQPEPCSLCSQQQRLMVDMVKHWKLFKEVKEDQDTFWCPGC